MRILFTGKFDPGYNRTKVITDGLHAIGIDPQMLNFRDCGTGRFSKLRKAAAAADVIFMPAFTHRDVLGVRACTRKPLIFDPLISRYLSKVFDYRSIGRNSPAAVKYFIKDAMAMRLPDVVLCDTPGHSVYFEKKFRVPADRLKLLPVGVNTDFFSPLAATESRKFTVGFYGSFIPLHGIRAILDTAMILRDRDIHFHLLGTGYQWEEMQAYAREKDLQNVSFEGWTDYEMLPQKISQFDVCLGIFGDGLKADIVVPNKIYHYAAMRKPVITRDTSAAQLFFSNGHNILLTGGSAAEIAGAILQLEADAALRGRIAENAWRLMHEKYTHVHIAEMFLDVARNLVASRG